MMIAYNHCRFTPDYSLTQVSNTLKIQTSSGNELLYPLLAILPHQLLAACFALQPRPEWEKNLAWLSVPFWLFVLLSIMATVFVQTKFGMRKGLIPYKNDSKVPILQPSGGQVFNLKDVQSALSKKIIEVQKKRLVCYYSWMPYVAVCTVSPYLVCIGVYRVP